MFNITVDETLELAHELVVRGLCEDIDTACMHVDYSLEDAKDEDHFYELVYFGE